MSGIIEIGLVFALLVAFSKSFQSVYNKIAVHVTDEYVTSWAIRFFGTIAILPAVLLYGVPTLDAKFAVALLVSGTISVAATILISKAFKLEEMSVVVPLFSFSPALLLITSPIILGEIPSITGIMGVLLITLGAYLLKATGQTSLLEPFRKLFSSRGAQYILLVLILYSISANVDKIGATHSSAVFWAFSLNLFSATVLLPIMLHKTDKWHNKLRENYRSLVIVGVLGGFASVLQMVAITLTLVVYVIAIKRLSIPLAVVIGYLLSRNGNELFNDSNHHKRIVASIIMVAGSLIIYLF